MEGNAVLIYKGRPFNHASFLDYSTLHVCHALYDGNEGVLVVDAERVAGADARGAAYVTDVRLSIVAVSTWCPLGDNLADSVLATADVVAQDDECCTIAVHTAGELNERLVRLHLAHSRPLTLAMTDIERIVVSDTSCHKNKTGPSPCPSLNGGE